MSGTWTFIQAKVGGAVTASLTQSATYASANTAGNLLVCQLGFGNGVPGGAVFSSLTDSAGNRWIQIGTTHALASGNSTALFYVPSCKAAGPNTVTVTLTGTTILNFLGISEYSPGAGFVGVLDTALFGTGGGTAISIGPMTIAGAGELILGSIYIDNLATSITAGAGYTLRYGNPTAALVTLEDILNSTSAAQTATMNITSAAENWMGWVSAFISKPIPATLQFVGLRW